MIFQPVGPYPGTQKRFPGTKTTRHKNNVLGVLGDRVSSLLGHGKLYLHSPLPESGWGGLVVQLFLNPRGWTWLVGVGYAEKPLRTVGLLEAAHQYSLKDSFL